MCHKQYKEETEQPIGYDIFESSVRFLEFMRFLLLTENTIYARATNMKDQSAGGLGIIRSTKVGETE